MELEITKWDSSSSVGHMSHAVSHSTIASFVCVCECGCRA